MIAFLRLLDTDGTRQIIPVDGIVSIDRITPFEVGIEWVDAEYDEHLATFNLSLPELLVAVGKTLAR